MPFKRTRKDDCTYHPHRPRPSSAKRRRRTLTQVGDHDSRGDDGRGDAGVDAEDVLVEPSDNANVEAVAGGVAAGGVHEVEDVKDTAGARVARRLVMLSDPWDILSCGAMSVTSESTVADVRRAYYQLSLSVHPDKLPGVVEATEAFQKLQWAYEAALHPDAGILFFFSLCVCVCMGCVVVDSFVGG